MTHKTQNDSQSSKLTFHRDLSLSSPLNPFIWTVTASLMYEREGSSSTDFQLPKSQVRDKSHVSDVTYIANYILSFFGCLGRKKSHELFLAYHPHLQCWEPFSSACKYPIRKNHGGNIKTAIYVWWQNSWWLWCYLSVIARRDRLTTLFLSIQVGFTMRSTFLS